MADLDAQFKQAVTEYKSGKKDKARDLLMEIVDKDEQHEQAWLYLSALVGSLEEQQICLENVLAINPNNARAKKGLDKVTQQISARDAAAAPPPAAHGASDPANPFSTFDWDAPEAPPTNGFGATPPAPSAPIGAEFESASGDSLMSSSPTADGFPSFDGFEFPDAGMSDSPDDSMMDWMNTGVSDSGTFDTPAQPAGDSLASSSSVDWDRSGGSPAYGSGKQVDLPSANEYDSWVQNLNLNNADAPAVPPIPNAPAQDTESAPLFGDTGYMIDDAAAAPQTNGAFFGVDESTDDSQEEWGGGSQSGFAGMEFGVSESPAAAEGRFDSFGQTDRDVSFGADSMFADPSASFDDDGMFGSSSPYADESDMYGVDDSGSASEFDDLDFSFDDDDDDFGEVAAAEPRSQPKAKAPKKPKKAAAADEYAPYFAQIPADIEASGSRRGVMLVGIVIMLGLNAASFAMLLL